MSHSKKKAAENAEYYHTLAVNIAHYRKQAGFTQAVLAEKVDISIPYLGAMESRYKPKPCSMETLFDLARALNISPHLLLKPLPEETE